MAAFWMSLGTMPPNGTAVLTAVARLHLPTRHSQELMELAWQRLKMDMPSVQLPPEMLALSAKTPAFLSSFASYYDTACRDMPVRDALQRFVTLQVVEESMQDWGIAMQSMRPEERIAIYNMSSIFIGCRREDVAPGMYEYLKPLLAENPRNNFYLEDPVQRQLIQALANDLDKFVLWTDWPSQPWFKRVQDSDWNNRDRMEFQNKEDFRAHKSKEDMLTFFLRLTRNMLVHNKPWPVPLMVEDTVAMMPAFGQADIPVLNAIPDVLKISMDEYLQRIIDILFNLAVNEVPSAIDTAGEATGSNGMSASVVRISPRRQNVPLVSARAPAMPLLLSPGRLAPAKHLLRAPRPVMRAMSTRGMLIR